LKQLIQFYSNSATNLSNKSSPLNFTEYAVLPHNIEIVMWPPITVTSLHPMYIDVGGRGGRRREAAA